MDKQEYKSRLMAYIPAAIDALNELKDISIEYNADFEGEGTFVRLNKKIFNQMTDALINIMKGVLDE